MAKAKPGSIPNKTLHSRVSYLYQAAAYLATQTQQQHSEISKTLPDTENGKDNDTSNTESEKLADRPLLSAARHLVTDLRGVALKAQLRISPTMKHAICKNCDAFLIDDSTSTSKVENNSKGAKKPWADVLVRKCNTCGFEKRFPLTPERQKRRPHRMLKGENVLRKKVPEGVC
jgi:ribonuclease P protein subunit RPR2